MAEFNPDFVHRTKFEAAEAELASERETREKLETAVRALLALRVGETNSYLVSNWHAREALERALADTGRRE